MKMKNEISAEGEGRVSRILVTAGQAVEGGDPLFEIEPTEP
jgi:biotin carboxyl carrier protein